MADLDYASPRSPGYTGPEPTADDRNMATLAHVLSIFTWFVGPLVIWLVKKDTSRFAADQAKESLNFQITCLIGYALGAATTPFFCLGFLILPVVYVFHIVMAIIAATKTNAGIAYRYPVAIRPVV